MTRIDPGKPIRLGIYSDTLVPRADGIAVSLEAAATALRELGVQLEVVAPYRPEHTTTALPIRTVPSTGLWGRDYRLGLVWPPVGSRATAAAAYDVVHVHTLGTVGIAGLYAAWRKGIPVVLTWHTDIVAYQQHYPEIRPAMRLAAAMWRRGLGVPRDYRAETATSAVAGVLQSLDLVVAPSVKVRDQLAALDPDARVVLLPSPTLPLPDPSVGVDALRRRLRLGPDDPVVLSVGRVSGEKNDELLLRAFAQLRNSHPAARLVLAGRCASRRRVAALVERLGIADGVHLAGVVPRDELGGYYAIAGVVVISSLTETQSLVAHEAEAAGCPLVVVDPWLAKGYESSRTLAEPNPADLASVVGRCLGQRTVRGQAAYWPDPQTHARQLLACYRQLTGADRSCRAENPG
jgi:1,2-diacylglycerol 3-alpha-glucosyltransferase